MDDIVLAVPRGRVPVDGDHLQPLQFSICTLVDVQLPWIQFLQDVYLLQGLTS